MYSGSHKYGRGGGKRNSFPPPPPHRNHPSSSSSRLPLGGSRSRTPSSPAPPPPLSADESFSLVGGGETPPFAAITRLPPDLVDEIKRVEAQGGAARIKFDSNSSNSGNVIDVGGKEFRFKWTDEFRSCDIYEERQSGEDGDGLLVESGLMWRKLTVQRVLDESTKKHVKMRSLECEQTLKSRKAIVLEPGNPSMKSQMKALAAAEVSPWKHKQKKDFHFKKKNSEPPQAGGAPKPVNRFALSSTLIAKGRRSISPLPSPQYQSILVSSPSPRGIAAESRTIVENLTPTQASAKATVGSSARGFSPQVSGRTPEGAVHRDNKGAGPLDLQHLLITLLKENPKGMSIKALEIAVGDVSSNSALNIDPILKKIAIYEPPGRYVLKRGVEGENLKSSPEENNQTNFALEKIYGVGPDPDSGFPKESSADDFKEQVPLNNSLERKSKSVENLDPARHLTDLFGDEPLDHDGGRAASSSERDSDSDSGSSNSGTDRSRNRSRSPVASASASSSDSDSSKSKETSDVEVDIMSTDEKELDKFQDTGHVLSATAKPWSMPEARPVQNGIVGDQDGYPSEDTPNLRGIGRKIDSSTKCTSLEPFGENATQPHRVLLTQQQSRSGRADLAVQKVEINRLEPGESLANQGMEVEDSGETQRKSLVNAPYNNSKHEYTPCKGKGGRSRKSKSVGDGADKRKDVSVVEARTNKRKRNDFSSDDDTLYTKYEKEEPELKEPIKNFSEYQDYAQEYRQKYESYCSLNKILENYRNDFQMLGMDLESAMGERYNTILAQLRESYCQCGTRHKRLKKIFIVLHDELKHLKQRIKDFALGYTRD